MKSNLNITSFNRIVDGNQNNWFQIDHKNGVITTTKNTAVYQPFSSNIVILVVEARDQSRFPKSTNTTVKVFIKDINDRAPTFVGDSFEVVLHEDLQPSTNIFTFIVEDYDSGSGGKINLSIDAVTSYPDFIVHSGYCQKLFRLSSNNMSLIILKSFKELTNDRYEVILNAKDRGIPSLSSKKAVVIKKFKNETQSSLFKFYPKVYYIRLSLYQKSSQTLQIKIPNKELFDPRFFIATDNEMIIRQCFDINSNTGLLTVKKVPSIKIKTLYKLNIEAFDKFKNVINATVFVSFNNKSFPSEIYKRSYKILVKENNANFSNRALMTFKTSSFFIDSKESNENITKCLIQSGDIDKSFRIIAKSSGLFELQAHRLLDRELLSFYNLIIVFEISNTMTDHVDNFIEVSVQINVTDINDNWPIFNSSFVKYCNTVDLVNIFKAEVDLFLPIGNARFNDFVFNAVAVDDDIDFNSKIVYSIMDPKDWFNVNTKTGVIRVNTEFKTKSREYFHEIKIKACDKGDPMRCSKLYLRVNIVKNIADFLPNALIFGNIVLPDQFIVFDCLKLLNLPFKVTPKSAQKTYKTVQATFKVMDKRFEVFPDGKVYKKIDFSINKTTEVNITIKLEDNFTYASSMITFTAESLLNENFQTNEYFNFNVSLPVNRGDILGYIIAKEINFDTPMRYYFCRDLNGNKISKRIQSLSIDTLTGKVSFAANISSYNLLERFRLKTHNQAVFEICYGSSTSKLIQSRSEMKLTFLTCQDLLYMQQIDQFKNIKVYENSSIGTVVLGSFFKTNKITKVKLLHNPSISFPFKLNSRNEVIISSLLDREIKSFYEFQYIITFNKKNCRNFQNSHKVTISLSVLDVNDFAPFFSYNNAAFTIKRSANIYSLVASVTAIDYDMIGKLRYSLKSSYSNLFEIDSNSGNIFLIKSMSHETKSSYKLTVAVNDGTVFSYTNITIKVEESLDQKLNFAPVQNCEIEEQIYAHKIKICQVKVLESNGLNESISYEVLKRRSDDKVNVSINNMTGDVYVCGEVVYKNYQTKGYFLISVIARINGKVLGKPKSFINVPIFVVPSQSTVSMVEMTSARAVLADKRKLVKNYELHKFTWSGMNKDVISLKIIDQLSRDYFTLRGNRLLTRVDLKLHTSRIIQVKVSATAG